jgi:hypothetical protein
VPTSSVLIIQYRATMTAAKVLRAPYLPCFTPILGLRHVVETLAMTGNEDYLVARAIWCILIQLLDMLCKTLPRRLEVVALVRCRACYVRLRQQAKVFMGLLYIEVSLKCSWSERVKSKHLRLYHPSPWSWTRE